MKFDELYKFLGYSLVCLLLFYIAARSIRFQVGIIESLVVGRKKEPFGPAPEPAMAHETEADGESDEEEAAI